jgi:hypothetical protein
MFGVERASAGLQMVIPGCERRTLPKSTSRVDEAGQGLLHFYRQPSLREKLESRADAPLRPSKSKRHCREVVCSARKLLLGICKALPPSRFAAHPLEFEIEDGPKVGDCNDRNVLSRRCGNKSPLKRNGYFEGFPHRRPQCEFKPGSALLISRIESPR